MAADPYKYFRIEAREILDDLSKGVLLLEKGAPRPDGVARMLRLAHTLKGAARVVKQREIADLAHSLEDAIGPLREDGSSLERESIDGALRLLDLMSARVMKLVPPTDDMKGVPVAPPEPSGQPLRTLRADLDEIAPLLDGLAELNVQLAGIRRSAATLEQVRALSELLADQLAPRATGHAGSTTKTLRTASNLQRLLTGVERDLLTGIDQVDRELGQVREVAERLRLLPAGLMFNALERAARDVAVSLGKQARFETTGGDVRLDADMLTAVQSALVQAVRNAVAHGIEPAAERVAVGKAPEGRIAVEVIRKGTRVSFRCSDDGRGIDLQAVRRVVEQRGSLPKGSDSEELLQLLLAGGISTSSTVTELSGRGIGLDVVRETANRLGGEVKLHTERQHGTTIELVVPASLFSLDALVVEASGQSAAIPLDTVRRTLRVDASQVTRSAEGESIVVEGKVIPFVSLSRSFRAAPATTQPVRRAWSAVIVESDGALAAVGVDRLLATENIVLRPLPDLTPPDPALAGASLDADGNPQMVLDPQGLVARARGARAMAEAAPALRRPILVIDDSLTTRMLEQSILESAGYEVDVATSGEEGLEAATRKKYAVFLVDVEMPGMDGFTFVERTRADPSLRETPAVLVTSRAAPRDRDRGKAVGAAAYIVKSEFDQTDLLERIGKLARQA